MTPSRMVAVVSVVAPLLLSCPSSRADTDSESKPEARQDTGRGKYGAAMADVGRRFELLGRASLAGRYELADYAAHELEEQFEDVLPNAVLPKGGYPQVIPPLVDAFSKAAVPDLQAALKTRDPAVINAAFERTAATCNGCHQASGHGFIEVPTVPGRSVPCTEPLAPRPSTSPP